MSERIAETAAAGTRARRSRPGARLRRLALWASGLFLIVPSGLILIFRFLPVPLTPLMVGTMIGGESVDARWVPLEAISPNLVRAVIASEDDKFCSHWGFDMEAIDKALQHNAVSDRLRGASTISQQTAKNLFLPPSRTWIRKGVEAYFTVLLEALWPKRRIIETYLNIAEWGPGVFGAEAAAEANFHKPAAKLSVQEAAVLAAVLPNPRGYSGSPPSPYVQRQSGVIAARMGEVRRDRLDACVDE
jgi:monofunctional biosynthetic peptidoglycan transglycosylase